MNALVIGIIVYSVQETLLISTDYDAILISILLGHNLYDVPATPYANYLTKYTHR